MNRKEVLTAFRQLGVVLQEKTNQGVGDCPFCNKEKHLYVALEPRERPQRHPVEPGFWDCKHCGRNGGVNAFLTTIHAFAIDSTTDADYLALAHDRQTPKSVFRAYSLGYYQPIERWLIPVRNAEGGIINLRSWEPGSNAFGIAGLPLGLFNLDLLATAGPIYLCEGEWDALALLWLLTKLKSTGGGPFRDDPELSVSVLGCPGANVWKPQWNQFFSNREVYICYDKDDAGRSGVGRVITSLTNDPRPPAGISALEWGNDLPEGYDLRDLISRGRGDPGKTYDEFRGLFQAHKGNGEGGGGSDERPRLPSVSVSDYEDLLPYYRGVLHLTPKMEDAILLTLATTASIHLPGDRDSPVWMFLIAPGGAGKTAILRSLEHYPECLYRSQMTPASLVSGINAEGGEDNSLIPKLSGKTLVLKDYTEVLSMPMAAQESIYGVLRGAFDGKVDRSFAARERLYDDTYFSFIAGVTHAIHRYKQAEVGERFLKFEMVPYADIPDHAQTIRAALRQVEEDRSPQFRELREAAYGFLFSRKYQVVSVPTWFEDRIVALAQIVSYLRAVVPRAASSDREILYRPVIEIGTRVGKQLMKLAQSLSIILGRDIDEEIYRVIKQVAMDSSIGLSMEVVQYLSTSKSGLGTPALSDRMRMSKDTILRRMRDLEELKAVESYKGPNGSGNHGNHALFWRLSDHLRELWDQAEIGRPIPVKVPRKKKKR